MKFGNALHAKGKITAACCCLVLAAAWSTAPAQSVRSQRFHAVTKQDAASWQEAARQTLLELMMAGGRPAAIPLEPQTLQRTPVPAGGYILEELSIASLPDRRVHVWMSIPVHSYQKLPAVLALHGHGGSGQQVVQGSGLYWYGRALAEMGYVVIAPDIGSHDLQHPSWALMGERTWDALRAIDYLTTRPEVDADRIAVAGLSLGGETAMYVAALDPRIKAACSSGWLTTIQNMKDGHCPCWNFPGLEDHFDFADIFACVAPRPLVMEIGRQEKAGGGFPVQIARQALSEIEPAYQVLGAQDHLQLDIHPGGHVFRGAVFWNVLQSTIGSAYPWNDETTATPPNTDPGLANVAAEARRRGEIARRTFCRALGVVDGWWTTCDPQTKLFPRRLDEPNWSPHDNAADMMPFLFITAHYLAPERIPQLMEVMRSEVALTNRVGPLPDWYSIKDRRFVHDQPDDRRLIFNAAEYSKDGLLPMTEVMGDGAWTERMRELTDAIFDHAAVPSDFGPLPADDTETNGDVLQVLARLYAMTRDDRYLQWAERIGDAYALEVLPRNGGLPAHRWDFTNHRPSADQLSLNDHGNELLGGLAELYAVTKVHHPQKAQSYREPLRNMYQRLLDHARNEDGLWYQSVQASTAQPLDRTTPDTWGYALAAVATFAIADERPEMLEEVRRALQQIDKPRYLDWSGADAYADSIEGALLLLNRLPEPAGFRWLEKILPLFLSKQRDDGIVEGWYGDGNYARTALMAGLYYTQGTVCRPWRPDLRFGAVRENDALTVAVSADSSWQGKLCFDTPRHRLHLRLPWNYLRLNEFPEWFTVAPTRLYRVRLADGSEGLRLGAELAEGLPIDLQAGQTVIIQVSGFSSVVVP